MVGQHERLAVSAWSSAQRLMVQSSEEQGGRAFSVIDAQGRVLCATSEPSAQCFMTQNCFASDGRAAVLCDVGSIWVWDFQGSRQLSHCLLANGFDLAWATWAWDSSRLLLEAEQLDSVLVWAPGKEQWVQPLSGAFCVGWDRHGCAASLQGPADAAASDMTCSLALCLHKVTRSGGLQHLELAAGKLEYAKSLAASACSPDGNGRLAG